MTRPPFPPGIVLPPPGAEAAMRQAAMGQVAAQIYTAAVAAWWNAPHPAMTTPDQIWLTMVAEAAVRSAEELMAALERRQGRTGHA